MKFVRARRRPGRCGLSEQRKYTKGGRGVHGNNTMHGRKKSNLRREIVLTFGKFSGRSIWSVPSAYLQWMLSAGVSNVRDADAIVREAKRVLTHRGESVPAAKPKERYDYGDVDREFKSIIETVV